MKNNLTKVLLIICLGILTVKFVEAQRSNQKQQFQNTTTSNCSVEYEDVINYLFPRTFVGRGNGYAMALRYSPPNKSETQVNIFQPEPGRFEVYQYSSKNGSILLQVQDIQLKEESISFNEIVKRIKVNKIKISLTENEIQRIRESFLKLLKSQVILRTNFLKKVNLK